MLIAKMLLCQGNNWRNAIPIVFDIEDGETVRRDFVFSVGGTVTGHHLDLETGSHLFVAVLRGSVVVTEADPEWSLDTFQQSVVGVAMATPFQIDDVEPGNHTLYVRYHPDPHTQPRYLLEGITVRAGEETYVELEW